MAEVPEPRHRVVLAGVAVAVVLVLTGARAHHGRGQIPAELLVGCAVAMAFLVVVFMVSTYRTHGRRRRDR